MGVGLISWSISRTILHALFGLYAGFYLAGSAHATDHPPRTPFVTEIAPDVFMRDLDGIYGSNQVFIIFDDYVVVFDPGRVPHARDLLTEIRARTEKPIRFVVVSHVHPDHAAGAAIFQPLGAEIVAAEKSRNSFENWGRKDFEKKLETQPDIYAGLTYALPTKYVEDFWALDDGAHRLELHFYGPGHTSGDLVGWLPEHRVLLAGDLSTNGQHNLASANVASWITVLERLQALKPLIVVPGHRSIAGPEILEKSHRYLVELKTQVQDMVTQGLEFPQVMEAVDIPFYTAWSGVAVRDEPDNVERVFVQVGGGMDSDGVGFETAEFAGMTVGSLLLAAFGWRMRGYRLREPEPKRHPVPTPKGPMP